jgi:LAO/AO transport system kinase
VGQSEVELDQAVDMFILLVNPGGGDDIQAAKKGVMEVVDLLLVGKADGDLLSTARHTKSDYAGSLNFIRPKTPLWRPRALLVSSRSQVGIQDFVGTVSEYHKKMTQSGFLDMKRVTQKQHWMWSHFHRLVLAYVNKDTKLTNTSNSIKSELSVGKISSRKAAEQLFDAFSKVGKS